MKRESNPERDPAGRSRESTNQPLIPRRQPLPRLLVVMLVVYIVWLCWLGYVAWVNVQSGNQ